MNNNSFDKFKEDFFDEFPALYEDERIKSYVYNYKLIKPECRSRSQSPDPKEARLTFGKYKGFLVADLYKMDAGKQYLTWLYSQSFFDAEKFPLLHKSLTELGTVKKKAMNATARATFQPLGA